MNQLPVPENSLRRYDVTSVTSYLIGLVIEQSNYGYQSAMIGFYQRVIKITRQVYFIKHAQIIIVQYVIVPLLPNFKARMTKFL